MDFKLIKLFDLAATEVEDKKNEQEPLYGSLFRPCVKKECLGWIPHIVELPRLEMPYAKNREKLYRF